jgi:N-acyl-D-amino-acid deacylase
MRTALVGALLAFSASAQLSSQEPFDLILRGGRVLTGSMAQSRAADVGVRGGKIAALGDLSFSHAQSELECGGRIVSPGFIDVHAHVDADVVRHPGCDNYLLMGVTTLITGNCGGSVADLAAHLARLEHGGLGVNYGSLVGLGTVRTSVLGSENRAPDDGELAAMCALVEQGMQAGAYGVSTGLIYVPGTYASTIEIATLAAVAARHGGIYASHMRNENDRIVDSIREILRIGELAGIPVHISHIKCTGKPNWGRAGEIISMLSMARANGSRITADQYAYDASSTGIDVLFPAADLAIGRAEFARQLAAVPAFRARMKQALFATMDRVGFGDFRYARIASAEGNKDLAGRSLLEAAKLRTGRDDRDAQAELAMELFIKAAPKRVQMIYHAISEDDVATFMAQDWIAIAADAGLRVEIDGDKPHPRGYGHNPRVLGRYVRELQVLDLSTAIHKMTAVPAGIFGITGRGELGVGGIADLVVFDPDSVIDRATYEEPTLPSVGIDYVIVNGCVAVDHGVVAKQRSGVVLRRGREKL